MNTRAKGRRNELRAAKYYIKEGFCIYSVPQSRKFQLNQDIFNLFDGIAKDFSTIWYQVKTNSKPCFDKYQDWINKYGGGNDLIHIWVFKDRKKEANVYTLKKNIPSVLNKVIA